MATPPVPEAPDSEWKQLLNLDLRVPPTSCPPKNIKWRPDDYAWFALLLHLLLTAFWESKTYGGFPVFTNVAFAVSLSLFALAKQYERLHGQK